MLLVGAYSVSKSIQGKASVHAMYENNLVPINLLSDIAENSLLIRVHIRNILLADVGSSEAQSYIATIQDLTAKDNALIEEYKQRISSPEEQRLYEQMMASLQELRQVRTEFLQTALTSREGAMNILRSSLKEKNERLERTINALITENRRQAEETKTTIESAMNLSTIVNVGGLGLAVLTALVFGFLLMRTVNTPLVRLTKAAEEKNFQTAAITSLASLPEEIGHLANALQIMSASVAQGLRLKQAMESLLSETTFEKSLDVLTDKAQSVMQTRFAALAMFDDAGKIETFLNRGFSEEEIRLIGHHPVGKGHLGDVHKVQGTMRTADLTKHQHSGGFSAGHPPMKTLLAVPILAGTISFGNLYVSEKQDGTTFTEQDEESLQTLANLAAKIIAARKGEEIVRQQCILEDQSTEIEMTNTTLQEQNRELEALNTEKTELMGIVAHDLKNPIGAVRGLAELIDSGTVSASEMHETLKQIIVTSDRMLALVTNVLDSNRLELGGMRFSIVEFDILPVVEATCWQYAQAAEAKNITIHYLPATASALALADEQALMQVLDNLFSNAIKYSPPKKNVFVRVSHLPFVRSRSGGHSSDANSSHSTDQVTNAPMSNDTMSNPPISNAQSTNNYVRVEVQDEGEGISREDMKRLFGKFARLSARPTAGEHSTGLGLSIVKKMVEAMNGRVWCESEAGKGATFIVELPTKQHDFPNGDLSVKHGDSL